MYIDLICSKLNDAGIRCPEQTLICDEELFTRDYPAIAVLTYLPDNKLQKMSQMDYSGFNSFIEVTRSWGESGLLKFEPYVLSNECTRPVMMLSAGRFLSLSKDGYFRISSDDKSKLPINDASYSIAFVTNNIKRYRKYFERSILINLWCFASFIDVACKHSSICTMLKYNPEELYDFFLKCMKSNGLNLVYSYDDLMSCVKVSHNYIKAYRDIYDININGNGNVYVAFGCNSIQVEYTTADMCVNTLTMTVPNLLAGCLINTDDTEISDFYDDFYTNVKHSNTIKALLLMLLKLLGIDMSWKTVISTGYLRIVKGREVSTILRVKSLSDIRDVRPDAF